MSSRLVPSLPDCQALNASNGSVQSGWSIPHNGSEAFSDSGAYTLQVLRSAISVPELEAVPQQQRGGTMYYHTIHICIHSIIYTTCIYIYIPY